MSAARPWLVTGATGFVGRHLVAALRADAEPVRALVRAPGASLPDGVARHVGDLLQPASLHGAGAGVRGVFHLAGYAHALHADAERARRVNVEGTRALLVALEAEGAPPVVYVSSVKATGRHPRECLDEAAATPPDGLYGRLKREAEALVLDYGRRTGAHVAILRPALVYGPGVKGNLAALYAAVRRGRFPLLPETGQCRSLVDVRDLVAALRLAMTRPTARGRVYHVTDGECYSTRRLALACYRACGRPPPRLAVPLGLLRWGARLGDRLERWTGRALPLDSAVLARLTESACYEAARIRRELGFVPRWRFEEAVREGGLE
ncbi:MAG: NAD-dependent epimerase/dehydratase family protein [Gammaproteobacteria bacterium]|nr:MAG: NAD-dependent epimerase/dehydratase family protein [Gammaproteobacteria bacterium]